MDILRHSGERRVICGLWIPEAVSPQWTCQPLGSGDKDIASVPLQSPKVTTGSNPWPS